ncbi:MAG: UDP-N-acetylmuramate dehydrogenase, partial [Oscillospiraceae bacterium]|nr:UDP-N-acetylmuramate dehydrogenase [Oscillospiraceae bacterium]
MLHIEEIKEYLKSNNFVWCEQESMVPHTTFRIGGPAALFIEASSAELLSGLFAKLSKLEVAPVIIGRGSNLLVSDKGIDAPVICVGEKFADVYLDESCNDKQEGKVYVYAQSGASLTKLCRFCLENSLSGLEFAYGIPGTVGGAIAMNAGAYGGEVKDTVVAVDHLTLSGQQQRISGDELDFGYRHSYYTDHNCCITGAVFALQTGNKEEIRALMEENMHKRQTKQPLEYPSAGSTFKRPAGNYASALIDRCGLKGRSVGGA